MTQFYSRSDTVFSGDRIFSIPFPYLKREHIKIFINNKPTNNFEWLNDSQLNINEEMVVNTDIVSICRTTPINEKTVTFTDNSILNKDNQNNQHSQNIYAIQELYDNNTQFKIDTNDEFKDFKTKINTTLSDVFEAAELIDTTISTVTNAVSTCVEKAAEAENQAVIAASEAQEAVNKIDEFSSTLDTALINIQQEGQEQLDKIKQTGFYMEDGKLFYQDANGEVKNFGGGFTPAMFQPFFSFTKLNHPSLVLANYSWLNKGYESAYNLLVERYNANVDQTETIGETTITFRYDNQYALKIITPDQIENADAIYAATRQAMYFILDVENTRFKLPRTDIMPQFTSDPNAVGGYNEPALANITGAFGGQKGVWSGNAVANGAFSKGPLYASVAQGGMDNSILFNFNASNSNSIYKDGATVQPPTNNVLLYFYLGESQIEQTYITGEVLENLNNKADISEVRELRDKLYEINKVTINPTLISSRIANGNFAIDISNIVPDDGCDYDLYLSILGDTSNNSSGNNRNLNIFLSPDYAANWVLRYTQDGTNQSQGTSAIIPLLKESRILYCTIFGTDNYTFKTLEVYLHAYRKVGV